MSTLQNYVDQILDDKYRLDRLLGKGGMGAVYLATHLGTERYVALKLIAPQFMRNEEFVERFKREAKAAGRLRHPNVVDVTDFGFAQVNGEPVAYLVMEYLDGCTLGDVLREEKRLPLEWVVDILEQVCSAVQEAHQQGIIHRDLKPENIWLEPNRLGGYRVKVLDFGIAKLGDARTIASPNDAMESAGGLPTLAGEGTTNLESNREGATGILGTQKTNPTGFSGAGDSELETMVYADRARAKAETIENDGQTQLFAPGGQAVAAATSPQKHQPALAPVEKEDPTLMFDQATRHLSSPNSTAMTSTGAELTRVGAIMGTPLYMSPEQCIGKSLDARADIYSLGVIAYQMLSGEPPFTGDTAKVMEEHVRSAPLPLRQRAKVPKQVAGVVMSALAKDPNDRPQSASAFANSLNAQAASIGSLYRRAFALYSEYFPKFLKLSLIAHAPVIVTTFTLIVLQVLEKSYPKGLTLEYIAIVCALVIVTLFQIVAYFVAAASISGMTAIIVTQISAAPLRPVELRSAFAVMKRRWRPFMKTSILMTLRILAGWLLIIPGIVMQVRYALYAPVVLMEGLETKAARIRARELASRSWRTAIIVTLLQLIIPFCVGAIFGGIGAKASSDTSSVKFKTITQHLSGLSNIFVLPLMSIVPALLYLKMRQMGGETLNAALAQVEEINVSHKQWQMRMRSRLSLPTPRGRTSKPSTGE